MVVGIRIDDLDPTLLPSLDHEIPVMKDGITTNMTVSQIADLVTAILVGAAPATLDTIYEIAAALGDDPNAITALTTAVGERLEKAQNLNDLPNKDTALTNLGFSAFVQTLKAVADAAAFRSALGINFLGYLPGPKIVYTNSASFVKASYPGIRAIRVQVQAPGGGGGGSGTTANRAGGGGGGGGWCEKLILVGALSASETITVGQAANAGGSSAAGEDGPTSSFGAHCSATGGKGGPLAGGGNGGEGGIGVGGDLNIKGGDGGPPNLYSARAGSGGPSRLGGGASGGQVDTRGRMAGAYGGGGGGTGTTDTAALAGDEGGDGVVIVELLY